MQTTKHHLIPTPQCHQSFCLFNMGYVVRNPSQILLSLDMSISYRKTSRRDVQGDVYILYQHPLRGRRSFRLPDGRILFPVSFFRISCRLVSIPSISPNFNHLRTLVEIVRTLVICRLEFGRSVVYLVCDSQVDDILASLRSRLCHRCWRLRGSPLPSYLAACSIEE